jgi:hypothetical protein
MGVGVIFSFDWNLCITEWEKWETAKFVTFLIIHSCRTSALDLIHLSRIAASGSTKIMWLRLRNTGQNHCVKFYGNKIYNMLSHYHDNMITGQYYHTTLRTLLLQHGNIMLKYYKRFNNDNRLTVSYCSFMIMIFYGYHGNMCSFFAWKSAHCGNILSVSSSSKYNENLIFKGTISWEK